MTKFEIHNKRIIYMDKKISTRNVTREKKNMFSPCSCSILLIYHPLNVI